MDYKVLHSGGKFYIKTENGEAELLYSINGGVMSIYHTFTPEGDRGRGVAGMLADAAFGFAKEKNLRVSPDCPYIVHYLETHPEKKKQSV